MIILTVLLTEDETVNKERIGIIHGIEETQNGYTFTFEDSDGEDMRCFSRNEPDDNGIHKIIGTMSEDGSIFFVSSMVLLSSE
jgi:hypothetical protein